MEFIVSKSKEDIYLYIYVLFFFFQSPEQILRRNCWVRLSLLMPCNICSNYGWLLAQSEPSSSNFFILSIRTPPTAVDQCTYANTL